MRGAYPAAVVRAAEEPLLATLPPDALMLRAAHGLAVHSARLLPAVYGSRVVLLVGAGNNGGDALYAGAVLARRGASVGAVLLSPDRAHSNGLAAFRAAGGYLTASPAGADLVLDGIVGIGGRGGLRASASDLVRQVDAPVVAVDVPSGVDADTGEVPGDAVRASLTVTFGCLKPGLLLGRGAVHAGRIELVELGLSLPPATLYAPRPVDVLSLVKAPGPDDDKYTRGVVGVAAGSSKYTGAALLAVGAAVRGPAGMVRYAGSAADLIRSHHPEVVAADALPSEAGRAQAWVVGPGLGTDDRARSVLADVLGLDVPVLVDADGITVLAEHRDLLAGRTAPTVLTPHDREFARIAGEKPGADRLGAARRAAADLGVVLLLKGDATVIARPDGVAYADRNGAPWLATAGSGDVLSGMIGALLASAQAGAGDDGATAEDAALAAVAGTVLHGMAGRLAGHDGMPTAAQVLARVPDAYTSL